MVWGTLAAAIVAFQPATARAADVPLPPPPPGMKRIPLPPPPPGTSLQQRSSGPAPGADRCTGCHSRVTQGRVLHGALNKHDCTACHKAITAEAGKCRSRTASKWVLVKGEPDLCYGCHARKDQSKSVHTAVRQGSCLSCHDAHSSNFPGRIKQPREKICFDCHDADSLVTKPVKHAPVGEGLCLDCHDAHGGNLPYNVKAESGASFCLKCHDVKAPKGRGTPGPAYRLDMSKKFVHSAFKKTDCLGCHEGGHGSDRQKLLKKNPVDLCYGCHERKDKAKYPHSAVVLGQCNVCHDSHSSDNPKRIRKATIQETCFLCHQDDLTGRKVVHAPIAKGCDQCHDSHGGPNRFGLKGGNGKADCYRCHKPVDTGKVKHAALERYGCTGCHDPHATAFGGLMATRVNDACIACHEAQKDGTHVSPMVPRGHVVGGNLRDPKRAGRDFTCASCHNPHGSDSPKLLYYGETALDSCAWCHGDKSGKRPDLKKVISNARRPTPGAQGAGGSGAGDGGGTTQPPGSGSGAGDMSSTPPGGVSQ